jgi:hypothetical protein
MKPTLVAAAALLLMLIVPATARAGDRPFRASGVATLEGDPFEGTSYDFNGTATHLGAFTGSGHVQFSISLVDGTLEAQGTTTFVAANGDELYASFQASQQAKSGEFVGTFIFEGGTGRFADSGGSAVVVATPLDMTSFLIQIDGAIDY